MDISAEIKDREVDALRQLKKWIDFALGDEGALSDDTFGELIRFTLDNRILSADEMADVAAASKSQVSRWRNGDSLPSDRHKKQGVMRDLQKKIDALLAAKAGPRKRQRRSKARDKGNS